MANWHFQGKDSSTWSRSAILVWLNLNKLLNKTWFSRPVRKGVNKPKKFSPDQIVYTFPVFGSNVQVFGVKVPPMKRIIFIKLYPTSKTRMLLSENLPQSSRFFTRIYPQYPWHYATLFIFLSFHHYCKRSIISSLRAIIIFSFPEETRSISLGVLSVSLAENTSQHIRCLNRKQFYF